MYEVGQEDMKNRILPIFLTVILCFVGAICAFSLNEKIIPKENIAYAQACNAPSITVKEAGYEGLKISWDKIPGASKYYVYRSASKSGTYKKIASTSKASYTDKKIDQNKTYYYKVKAASGNAASEYSKYKSGKISTAVKLKNIPKYKGEAYTAVNNNVPKFSKHMMKTKASESYSKLDSLGRCGTAYACIGLDLMPTQDRESIGMIKPAGWHTVRYDDLIDGKYLYNRCHLIGYQLSGENANEKNLITGTRYLNITGMLPFENDVAAYVKRTGNHVLYRVTPIYSGKDLLCRGVQMEAYSVEDDGEGISFNVFAYNVQPGIKIDYATGQSSRASEEVKETKQTTAVYVLNTNTKKFHYSTCSSVKDIADKNKKTTSESRESIINKGYKPCKRCNP